MTFARCGLVFAALAFGAPTGHAAEVWKLEGFDTPESVLFDETRSVFYVSNVGGEPSKKDGNGFISRISPEGEIVERDWVTGLDGPAGLVISGDTLFVSDIDRLVAIDIAAGTISGTWPAEGAIFLNDTAVDAEGRVYVSDMITNRIHVLADGELSVFAEGDMLKHPNGLAVSEDALVVAAWGSGLRDDFTTESGGNLLSVDLESRVVSDLGSGAPIGNLDGLEPDGAGNWLVTDWIAGALYRIAPDGSFELLRDLPQGSADLEYVEATGTVVIPLMKDGEIIAETLD